MVFGIFQSSKNNPYEKSTAHSILNLQLKCFLYGGIRPSESIRSSPWKLRVFNIFSALTVIMYIPSLFAQCYALYLEFGNVTEMTGVAFAVVAAFLHFFISSYLLLNRKPLEHLIVRTEEFFTEFRSKLPLGREHTLIMTDATKKIRIYSWIFIITNVTTCFLWIFIPFVFWNTHNQNKQKNMEKEDGEIDDEVHWEHLCYRMWVPATAFDYPFYYLVWIYQALLTSVLLLDNTGYNSMYYAITIYAAAHFKILVTLLQNIDQYITSPDCTESLERSSTWSDVINVDLLENEKYNVTETVLKNCSQSGRENKANETSELEAYLSLDHKGITASIQRAEDYLVNCIKYHQAILR
jgi:hypothetical protein